MISFGKKGISPQILLYIVLGVLLLLILLYLSGRNIAKPLQSFSSEDLKIQRQQCLLEVETAKSMGIDYIDFDVPNGDDCLDSLDACLGGDMSDTDLDGMPDDCDSDSKNPKIYNCKKHIAQTNKQQCCTESYHTDQALKRKDGYIKCK